MKEIVQLIADKGFVRSDFVETEARAAFKMIKQAANEEEREKVMNNLMTILHEINWE
jgi:predicted lipid-binding transport protein (Tim44 family)